MGQTASDEYINRVDSFARQITGEILKSLPDLYAQHCRDNGHTLQNAEVFHFCNSLIHQVTPTIKEDKRKLLLDTWTQNRTSLTYAEILDEIKSKITTEFSFTFTPLKKKCLSGVKVQLPCSIEIKTPAPEKIIQRPPLAVVCTLDRSGSMSGKKIEFAKRAIEKVIKHLDVTDTFHLVSYDERIVVEIKNGDLTDKQSLKAIVKSIRDRGSTNICDALTKSAALLTEADLPANTLKRIFLFSDGEANAGEIQTAPGFKTLAASIFEQQQISICTFGLGSDYNEEVMRGIAINSKADYYFIEDAKNIPATMSKAIHGLIDTYARDVYLRIRGKNDGLVTKFYGKYANHPLTEEIPLGDIFHNDSKRLLLELELSSRSENQEQIVCEALLRFTPFSSPTENVLTQTVSIFFTQDDAVIKATPQDNGVYIAVLVQEVAAMDRDIISLLDKGKQKEAIELKEKTIAKLKAGLEFDSANYLPKVIARAETLLTSMKSKKEKAAVRKMVDYEAKCEEECDNWGYVCYSDSDEEAVDEEVADNAADDLEEDLLNSANSIGSGSGSDYSD